MPSLPPLSNRLPALPASAPYRLALLLPWPSEDDCRIGRPLTTSAGHLLRGVLAANGLVLDNEVAVCHLSQHYLGTWEAGGWEGEQVQQGIAALAQDLSQWRPNIILGLDDPRLGAGVLHLLRNGNVAPHRTPSGYQWTTKLGKWRGSLFAASLPGTFTSQPVAEADMLPRYKCLTTYHPAYVQSVWSKAFEMRQDVRRAREEARSAELALPTTNISYGPVE